MRKIGIYFGMFFIVGVFIVTLAAIGCYLVSLSGVVGEIDLRQIFNFVIGWINLVLGDIPWWLPLVEVIGLIELIGAIVFPIPSIKRLTCRLWSKC